MSRGIGFALSVALFTAFSSSARAWTTYLVSAGNNQGMADEATLLYAERDAAQFAGLMGRLGRVKGLNTILALGEPADDLRKTLLRTNVRIRKFKENGANITCLIVFYSGHADARGLHLGDTVLPFDELKTMVEGSAADVRILIIDACRSGGLTKVKGASPTSPFDVGYLNRTAAEGLVIITSSAAGENAYESEKMRSSFFSHHFQSGLRGAADKDRDRRVTLDEAYRYAYQETLRSSGRTDSLQHPTFQFNIRGKGKLVLTYLNDDAARSGNLNISTPGAYLLHMNNGQETEITEITVADKGARLVLPPGNYFIQRRNRTYYTEYRFPLVVGESRNLESISSRTVKYAKLVRKGGGEKPLALNMQMLFAGRGEIVSGVGLSPHGVLGIGLDFPWISIGLRGRYTQKSSFVDDGGVDSVHREVGIGFTLQRFFDFRRLSLIAGILLEGIYHRQLFESDGTAPSVSSWSFAFGVTGGVELEIMPAFSFIIESGPLTNVFRSADIRNGAVSSEKISTRVAWWASGGVMWKF